MSLATNFFAVLGALRVAAVRMDGLDSSRPDQLLNHPPEQPCIVCDHLGKASECQWHNPEKVKETGPAPEERFDARSDSGDVELREQVHQLESSDLSKNNKDIIKDRRAARYAAKKRAKKGGFKAKAIPKKNVFPKSNAILAADCNGERAF